jgi:hypothetical protein
MLPLFPILCLGLVEGARLCTASLVRRRWLARRGRRYLLAGGLILLLGMNAMRVALVVAEERAPDFPTRQDGGQWADYQGLVNWLGGHAKPDDVILCYEHRYVHYMTGLRTRAFNTHGGVRVLKQTIFREDARYAVIDPRKDESARLMQALGQQTPGAFESVATVGRLQVVRLYPDGLADEYHQVCRWLQTNAPAGRLVVSHEAEAVKALTGLPTRSADGYARPGALRRASLARGTFFLVLDGRRPDAALMLKELERLGAGPVQVAYRAGRLRVVRVQGAGVAPAGAGKGHSGGSR